MTSPDLTVANIEKVAEMFPTIVTESIGADGNIRKAIDFDLLRQELADHIVEGPQERYRLDWPGKRAAAFAANAPIAKTLRPVREESVDFDTTQNLFIEGDNLDALKLLQESYLGKVKMIYIDPPYNTGNDFVYNDDFAETTEEYLARSGQANEEGARLTVNLDTYGRFHSDWLSMLYPRLKLARNLLAPDGLIMVSIGDGEVTNMRSVLTEVFGAKNFAGQLVWEKKKKGAFLSGTVSSVKEYVLCFARDRTSFGGLIGEVASASETYPVIQSTNTRGIRTIPAGIPSKYREKNHFVPAGTTMTSGNQEMVLLSDLNIVNGFLIDDLEIESNWRYGQDLLDGFAQAGDLYVTQDLYLRRIVREPRKKVLKDLLTMRGEQGSGARFVLQENLFADGWGTNEDAFDELHDLFGAQNLMSFPKPTKLIAKLIASLCREDSEAVVLDFFAGSATTADALMQLNAQDGGKRRFIMVQLDEKTDSESAASKAGFATISALGRERIRRAGKLILSAAEKLDENLDVGFRALRVDTTNLADVRQSPDEIDQLKLDQLEGSVKSDRSAEDLLFQVLLDWGLELTMPISVEQVEGKEVFVVEDGALIACFEEHVSPVLVHSIAKRLPLRAVFRDSGFESDAARINAEQVFREQSPATDVKAI